MPSEFDSHRESEGIEKRIRNGAFVTLAGLMAAHALLETARDALFLANLPIEKLPTVYLVIAAITLVTTKIAGSLRHRLGDRRTLSLVLLTASAGTVAGHYFVSIGSKDAYFGLYVWSGVISSLAVLQFWLALGERLTITQGKRLYAQIAMGGSIGALVGFGLATLLARFVPAESLLLVSAAIFAVCALGSFSLIDDSEGSANHSTHTSINPEIGLLRSISNIAKEPYSRGVASLLVLATLSFTLADFLFKALVAREVASEDLASWLGAVYLALNLASMLVLAFIATPLLRRIGLQRSLAILPIFFVVGGMGLLVGMAMTAIGLLKTAEGVLRHSVHRTASELLFLPMTSGARNAAKTFTEVVGDKGAKALASLGILAMLPLPHSESWLAAVLVVLAVGWIATAFSLRKPYLDVFRRTLSEDSIATRIELPGFDPESLETLVRALNHSDDRYVKSAISLLEDRGQTDLIPTLILYHPSDAIVEQAIEVFARAKRGDFAMHTGRLLDHDTADIRAATTRAIAVMAPDRDRLENLAQSDCVCIRISAVSGLLRHEWIDPRQASLEFLALRSDPRADARRALARSARLHYSPLYRESLESLAIDDEAEIRSEAVEAIRESDDAFYTPVLIGLLGDRTVRESVRAALLDRGEPALAALSTALFEPATDRRIAKHIPESLARFESADAASILLAALEYQTSGVLHFKILTALRRLRANTSIEDLVDTQRLESLVWETAERALELLHWQVEIEAEQSLKEGHKTTGGELLLDLLRDKERLAIRRIFMLLSLRHPNEDFDEIASGIESAHQRVQASGVELLENILSPERARALIALITPATDRVRLERSGSSLAGQRVELELLLANMVRDRSPSLRAFAGFYSTELNLDFGFDYASPERNREKAEIGREAREDIRTRALALINRLPEGALAHG
jgi:AAA family ATP:ADP antiporter